MAIPPLCSSTTISLWLWRFPAPDGVISKKARSIEGEDRMRERKTLRLDTVMEALLSRDLVTADELAVSLGTSRRTIYRYMEALKDRGISVEACPGSKGGFRLSENNPNLTRALNSQEILSIMLAGLAVAEHNVLPNNESLESGLEKIKVSLAPAEWARMQEQLPNISLMVGKLYQDEHIQDYLEAISAAIHARISLDVSYSSFSSSRTETRRIDPYHLLFQGGAWYVVGFCRLRAEIRTFRVDRMRSLTTTDEYFERPRNFSLNAYLGASWGIMRGQTNEVIVKFYPPTSRYIMEGNWHPSQTLTREEDGSVIFTATVDGLDEVRHWIMSFGGGAQVLKPEALRKAIADSLAEASARYNHGTPN